MLLQIWVLPPSQAEATENSALLSHGAIAPAGSRTFLESCPANITLEQLCARICSRHDRIYPDRAPLAIKKLQDFYNLDLDLDYITSDIFKDRDSGNPQSSVVKVIQTLPTREDSVPPESALRPTGVVVQARKRHRALSIAGIEDARGGCIQQEHAASNGHHVGEKRLPKRQRLQEVSRSPSPNLNLTHNSPDEPLPSREMEENGISTALASDDEHGDTDNQRSRTAPASHRAGDVQRIFGDNTINSRTRLQKLRSRKLSPSIVPDSPILGGSRYVDPTTQLDGHPNGDYRTNVRSGSSPDMDDIVAPGKSSDGSTTRTSKLFERTNRIERFKSLPPAVLLSADPQTPTEPSSRRSLLGPTPSTTPYSSGRPLATLESVESLRSHAQEKDMSIKQANHSAKPNISWDNQDNARTQTDLALNGKNGPRDIYEFVPDGDSRPEELVQTRLGKRKYDERHGKVLEDQKSLRQNERQGPLRTAKSGAQPPSWAGPAGNSNARLSSLPGPSIEDVDHNGIDNKKEVHGEESVGKVSQESSMRPTLLQELGLIASREAENKSSKREEENGHPNEKMAEKPKGKSQDTTNRSREIDVQKPGDSEPKKGNSKRKAAKPNGIKEVAVEAKTKGSEVGMNTDEITQSNAREVHKQTAGQREAQVAGTSTADATDKKIKQKLAMEQEDYEALEAVKRQLKAKNDRLTKEWEERHTNERETHDVIAAANSQAFGERVQRRVSTTPMIPKGLPSSLARSRTNTTITEMNLSTPSKLVGIDSQLPLPRSIKRTVAFVDDITPTADKHSQPSDPNPHGPQKATKSVGPKSEPETKNDSSLSRSAVSASSAPEASRATADKIVAGTEEFVVKHTPVYPPGMGPENLRPAAPVLQDSTSTAAAVQDKSQQALQKAPQKAPVKKKTQAKLQVVRDGKGKGKATRRPPPAIISKPGEEVVISSDEDESVSSYYSSSNNRSRVASKEAGDDAPPAGQDSRVHAEDALPVNGDQLKSGPANEAPEPHHPEAQSSFGDGTAAEKADSRSRSHSASPSSSDAQSSISSSTRSSTRSPARYISQTPQSDSGSENGSASTSPSGSPSDAEDISKVPSGQGDLEESDDSSSEDNDSDSPSPRAKSKKGDSAQKMNDSPVKSSIPLPSNEKGLNEYLQQHARQSSLPSYPATSSQPANQVKSKRTGGGSKNSNHPSSQQRRPKAESLGRDPSAERNIITIYGNDGAGFGKTLSRQLSSQLERTSRQSTTAARAAGPARTPRGNPKAGLSKTQYSDEDSETDSDDDDEDDDENEDEDDKMPPSSQNHHHHHHSNPTHKTRSSIPSSSVTTTTTAAAAAAAVRGTPSSSGKARSNGKVASQLSGLLKMIPFGGSQA